LAWLVLAPAHFHWLAGVYPSNLAASPGDC